MCNGNNYVIKLGAVGSEADIAGQLDGTMTLGGTSVEVTNKGGQGYLEYCADFVAGKQVVFAGNFVMMNETVQNSIKEAIEAGTILEATIMTGIGGEEWQGTFKIEGRSDTAPLNGAPSMACSFMSSGVYTYIAPTVV